MTSKSESNPFADPRTSFGTTDRPARPAPPSNSQPKSELDDYNPFDAQETAHAQPTPETSSDQNLKGSEGGNWLFSGFNKKKQDQNAPESNTRNIPTNYPSEYNTGNIPTNYPPESNTRNIPTNPPPSYSDVSTSALRELKEREEDIARKEAALNDREQNLDSGVLLGPRQPPNNFPPLPGFCPIKPCFYHNIAVEIPPSQQRLVRLLLVWLIVHLVAYVVNTFLALLGLIAALVLNVDGNTANSFFANFGISIPLLIFFVPLAVFCWYLPIYKAYKNDSSMNFMWFFFVMLFQFIIYIAHGLGIPGACGLYTSIVLFANSNGKAFGYVVATLYMVFGIFWFSFASVLAFFVFRIHRYYRLSGASLAAARQEMFTAAASNQTVRSAVSTGIREAATNEHVRTAVADGVKSGVRSGFS